MIGCRIRKTDARSGPIVPIRFSGVQLQLRQDGPEPIVVAIFSVFGDCLDQGVDDLA